MLPRAAALLCLLCSTLAAAERDAGPTGVLTKAPALLKQVSAVFPPELADAGTTGTVGMEVDVGADGKVLEVRVVQSAGEAFDAAALEAVRQFEFSPAEVDGAPAAVRLNYAYTFTLTPQVVELPPERITADAGTGAGVVNFKGRLVERGTRDPLAGASVFIGEGEGRLEVTADEAGNFEAADVPLGPQKVLVTAPEHDRYQSVETFKAGERTEVLYYVRPTPGRFSTLVKGERERKDVSSVKLSREEIRYIPGTQGDAFKVIQNLPGVARPPFGIGLLIVRGSKPWDTRTYIDEAPIPILFHFGGVYATYNANLLDDIGFQAGNFGAEFGRSIGGLVRGTGKELNKKGVHGYVDLSLLDATALLELPLSENWSLAVSARRSYVDVLLPAILGLFPGAQKSVSFSLAPRYYDFQAKVEWRPAKGRKRFFVSLFGSDDQLRFLLPNPAIDPEGRGEFGTTINYNRLVVGFDTPVSGPLSFSTRTSFGIDRFGLSAGSDIFFDTRTFPVVSRNTFKWDFEEQRLKVNAGLDLQVLPYILDVQAPAVFAANQVPDPFASRQLRVERATVVQVEPALFAEAIWRPWEPLKLVGGLRADYNSVMNKAWVDPRFAAFYTLNDTFTLKGAVGLYHQPPDYRQGLLTKTFGNPNLAPEGAVHGMVGTEARFTEAISLDVQLYYKGLFSQARPTLAPGAGADVNVAPTNERYTSKGYGRSYGAELLLRHALTKNFFGWIAYSFSRTERDFLGQTAYGVAQFDQPHNLIVIASYKLPFDFQVGARLRFASGPLSTPIVGAVYDANGNYYFPIQGTPFSRRLPDFFQLDVRIDKRFVFEKWTLALYLDVQNVTNRMNVEAAVQNFNYTQEGYLFGLPIFPALGIRGEF